MTRSTKAHVSKSEIARQEMADQHDPIVRAFRLARFKKATEGKVWRQNNRGEWILVTPLHNAA